MPANPYDAIPYMDQNRAIELDHEILRLKWELERINDLQLQRERQQVAALKRQYEFDERQFRKQIGLLRPEDV